MNKTEKHGKLVCERCGAEFRYSTRKRILKSTRNKCRCTGKTWKDRDYTLSGFWRDELLFRQSDGFGIEECQAALAELNRKAKERYEKAERTSFSHHEADESLKSSHGVLVARE